LVFDISIILPALALVLPPALHAQAQDFPNETARFQLWAEEEGEFHASKARSPVPDSSVHPQQSNHRKPCWVMLKVDVFRHDGLLATYYLPAKRLFVKPKVAVRSCLQEPRTGLREVPCLVQHLQGRLQGQ
jgi:hypothetical protein